MRPTGFWIVFLQFEKLPTQNVDGPEWPPSAPMTFVLP